MRLVILTGLVASAFVVQVPTLDLTVPPSGSFEIRRSSDRIAQLPLVVTLNAIQDQPYTIDDDFSYEIQVANSTQAPIAMAWSDSPVGARPTPALARVDVILSRLGAPDRFLVGAFAFGDPTIPSSMLSLQPGGIARIRAAGRWQIPLVTDLAAELLPTAGRYQLRARLTLDDGEATRRSALSDPVWITLVQRPSP